jgi:hypothetical protein
MAKVTGKNAVIDFASTVYACLTDIAVNGTANVQTAECSSDGTGAAVTHRATGAEAWSVTASILHDANDSTVAAALDTSTSGALKAYPEGDETGALEYSWTTAIINVHNVTSSPGDFLTLDVTFDCDGSPTIGDKV